MHTSDNCTFCRIVSEPRQADDIFENENILVILDIDWAVKGHTLVVWKKHVINASDLSEQEFSHFSKVLHRTEAALLKLLHKDRSVILKTGGLVPHFHFHIYPVSSHTSWKEIKDMFDKKVRYKPKESEKEEFLEELKRKL